MSGGRTLRSRIEVWLYRKLRPLVAEREERPLPQLQGTAPPPEPTRQPGILARHRRLAAGAVLVVAAATGWTVVGYEWGYEDAERASPEPAVQEPDIVPGPPPERAPWPPPERAPNQVAVDPVERLPLSKPQRDPSKGPQPAPWPPPASKSER